jgi:hypothetical protein
MIALAALPVSSSRARTTESPRVQEPNAQDATDVLGANAACLVCHLTFVKEELARGHQLKGVACTKCHGPSLAHANDEHVGATKPDILFTRAKVDAGCKNCHSQHDVPAREVVKRFLERKLPVRPDAICTDCHGTHRIEKADKPAEASSAPKEPREGRTQKRSASP